MNPQFPIYIISKGRWESRQTVKAFEYLNVPFRIVVEPQEFEQYAAVIDPKKILQLPFANLGQGSIPARNWVWEHAKKEGHEWHWILDDNIRGFYRLNKNLKTPISDGAIFKCAEDFTLRYQNIAQSGFNYDFFIPDKHIYPAYYLNTRIYSCILLPSKLFPEYAWRGRYNEDTDLSLRFLKDGWCTVLFNAFLAKKAATMTLKGGNTDELYRQDKHFDGRLEMAKSLQAQHPDVVKITQKWHRWQHQINYAVFTQQLKRKPDVKVKSGVDNYGMVLKHIPVKKAQIKTGKSK